MRKILSFVLLAMPMIAYANIAWPALYLETRLTSWWAISVGLIVEYFFIMWLFGVTPKRAAIADLVANAISTIAGVVLIPAAGFLWQLSYYFINNIKMYLLSWIFTLFISCIINSLIEGLVYKKIFKFDLRFRSKKFWWLVLANAFSVGVAFISLWVAPPARSRLF